MNIYTQISAAKKLSLILILILGGSLQSTAQSLVLDGGFNGGVSDAPPQNYTSAVQTDGKILVGGLYNFVNGFQTHGISRLNADGTRDISFNTGGSGLNINGNVLDITVLSSGKILIGGSFGSYNGTSVGSLARLNADGTLDTTFNVGGSGVSGGRVTWLAVQPDGKVLVVGQDITGYNGNTSNGVFRINADGSFDSSFVSGFATSPSIEQIELLPDGKALIGGQLSIPYSGNTLRGIFRVNANGSFDNTFSTSFTQATVAGFDLQPDGKIVVGGFFQTGATPSIAIARLNANGSLDNSFTSPLSGDDSGFDSVKVQPDGKILAAGVAIIADQNYSLVRFNSDGTLDNSLLNVSDDYGYNVRLQADGKILLAGLFTRFAVGGEHNGLARFNANGTIDNSFSPQFTKYGSVRAIAQQSDGKVIVGGQFGRANGSASYNIARFNADGTFDNTFATGTGTSPDRSAGLNQVNALAIQPDGKVLVGGQFGTFNGSTQRVLIRLNSNGSVDSSFNLSGDVNLGLIPNVEDILVLPDGKIMIGGALRRIAGQVRGLLRLNSNGSVDETFNSGGNGANSTVFRVLRQADGKYIIGGQFTTYNGTSRPRIARINVDGTLDTTFTVGTGANSTILDAALQTDGKIIIGGNFTAYNGATANRIARLNSDGTLDGSFNAGTGANSTINSLAFLPNGKIMIGGLFTTFNGAAANRLARLNAGGDLDATFNSALDTNASSFVKRVFVQRDGKPLIGGAFVSYSGNPRNGLARLFTPEIGGGDQPLLFTSTRDGNNEIYRMNADGTNQQRLTNTPENESGGFWSPDGQKILFVRQVSNILRQIWIMNADGSNQTLLSPPTGFETVYRFSPNGQKILFGRSTLQNDVSIWTMNADGSNRTQLTPTGSVIDLRAEWSPNGSQITFARCTNTTFVCDIYKMNADGSNLVNLTADFIENDDFPKWTSDGSRILFIRGGTASGYRDVFSMNADGTNVQRLTNTTLPTITADLIVSRNSNKAMFVRAQEGPLETHEIFTMNTDGSNQINLTNNSLYDGISAWSPDNSKIAFISRRESTLNEIYTMNADGTQASRLTFNFANDFVTDWRQAPIKRAPFDFDGDGKSDNAVFRPSNGVWYLNNSTSGFSAVGFGLGSDIPTAADFDGDGKTDISVFRPSNGAWYRLNSSNGTFSAVTFGTSGDLPVAADFDGDGKADVGVFRPSNGVWYRLNSSNGAFVAAAFGSNGDKPIPQDFDGDGKADIAVYRPSDGNWYINRSTQGFTAVQFGIAEDKPTAADYDGDGKADVSVFRPSNGAWYRLNSSNGQFAAVGFGITEDLPTMADYDGDGKADISVFRPSSGVWYRLNSSNGAFAAVAFGTNGDFPVHSIFAR